MPLVPTKMADAQCSVCGNHWPGGPHDMLTTTSACVNSSPASLSHLQDGIFYKYVVFKHPLSLWPNVHFVQAVLQPLFVSYLHSFISLALFIHLFYPCAYIIHAYIMPYSKPIFNIKLVEKYKYQTQVHSPTKSRKKQNKKQSTNIKRDEINIMNIINDNTFNLYNSFLIVCCWFFLFNGI